MSTPDTTDAKTFELRVTITGLCLLLIGDDRKEVTVLMPNAREGSTRAASLGMFHSDATPATPHVAYLSVPLMYMNEGASTKQWSNVVRLISHEQIDITPSSTDGVTVDVNMPDFEVFAPGLQVQPTTMLDNPGDGVIGRCTLWGGTLSGTPDEMTRQMTRVLSSRTKTGIQQQGDFAHPAVWTRAIRGDEIKVTLTSFADHSETETLTLRPVEVAGKRRIELTIANLCSWNPLEWEGFETPPREAADVDFKWYESLMEVKPNTVAPKFDLANPVPHPVANSLPETEGAIYNCVPGRAGYPPK